MTNARMRRFTGICALATILLWLGIFPLYTAGPLGSPYDGAALASEFFRFHNIVFTRILLGMGIYVTMLVFAVGLRDLIRRADAEYEWVGTLGVSAMAVWVGVTLVANGLEGGAALDALMGSGWGAAIIANFPPLLWFLVVGILLIRKRQTLPSTEGAA